MGRKKFNMDPKKVNVFGYLYMWTVSSVFVSCLVMNSSPFLQGIVFLVENELLRHTPEDIAQFLYKGEGLNKTAIGDYLGERCLVSKYLLLLFSFRFSYLYSWYFCCCSAGMTSTSKFFRPLSTSMSSLISTLSRPSGKLCVFGLLLSLNQGQNLLIVSWQSLVNKSSHQRKVPLSLFQKFRGGWLVQDRSSKRNTALIAEFVLSYLTQILTCFMQTVPVEFPFAWGGPEDW